MASRPTDSAGSYTVVIIPLRTGLCSPDGLRFYLRIKRLKDLQKEKDALWSGVEILEKTRLWYLQRLKENRVKQVNIEAESGVSWSSLESSEGSSEARSCLLRSLIQRANGSLGSVMSEPNVTGSGVQSPAEAVVDSDLRWHNTVLSQEVSDKNRQISVLELEKGALLGELDELQAP